MAKRKSKTLNSLLKEIKGVIKEVDGSVVQLTGKPLREYLGNLIKDMGDDVAQVPPGKPDPYMVLGVNRGASKELTKQVYLALVKLYHESGAAPNPVRIRDINSAYDQICKEKGWSK